MGTRKYDRIELMNARDTWTEPAIEALSENKRNKYLSRKRAVDMYIDGEQLEDINSKTGIDKSHIVKYVDKCLTRDASGCFVGYIALCPGKSYKGSEYAGYAPTGNFERLLERYTDIKPFLEGNYFGYEPYTAEKNMSLTTLHKKFLDKCIDEGLGKDDYPFNTVSQGYYSLRRYVKELELSSVRLANRRTDKDAAQKAASTGYGDNHSPIPVAPFSCGQIDGHKLDLLYVSEIELEDGSIVKDICERCWFLPVIDSATRVVVGYYMSQETNYNQFDLMKGLKCSIMPHKKMQFTIPGLEYPQMEGFPSLKYPELEYALFDEIMLDNAKSHLSKDVVTTLTEKLGICLNYGSVATPETRGIVERFFKTLEIRGIHTLPGTTGSHSKDPKQNFPRKQAIKYGITFDDICQIMEILICEYNNSPHSALLNRTPLEVMGEKLELGMLPHIATKQEREEIDKMLFIPREVTVRGSAIRGKRPYITFLGARYRGAILSVNYSFLGKKLFLRINPDDVSCIDAYDSDGNYIEKLTAVGEYGHKKHSLVTRRLAMRYANNNKKEHSEFSTPLSDLEQSLLQRAKTSKKARTRSDIIKREQESGKTTSKPVKKTGELIRMSSKADIPLDHAIENMTSEEVWIHMQTGRKRRSL